MKVTFLGTGTSQGIPIIGCTCPVCKSKNPKDKRLRTSIALEIDGKYFVIDTGPDFRQQMLRIELPRLDAVIFTHSHKDHICGFDDIRAFNYIQKEAIDVYLEDQVMRSIERDFFYMFEEFQYPGIPQANFHRIENKAFNIKGIDIKPIRVLHYKMPVLGFRIKNFAYITDANYIDEEEIEKLKNLDVLVLNALRRETHISHFSLDQALEMVEKIKPKKAYLTHMSHQIGQHHEVNQEMPQHVQLAFDGLEIDL